ncbi:glycogen debranching enzyme [Allomyces macrogynus ATCC 38327]|uniref:Glycogen debranching enzyme n=1 Tax=Allomyces macrogynus (strain ATCC 38327) TaxID=578462 RepID=A0A0L0TF30_ALLM3|nr:glycogen debranching enzyme [Allomyces macrogynus ATCC 38327]|eukprot:KNE73199.1 glycogen debranching enzyme [Allomyces macrogynus ATCC 38327]
MMAASVVALPAARVAQHDPARTAFKQPATRPSAPAPATTGFTADPDAEFDESLAHVAVADHATLLLDQGVPAGPVRQFKLTGPHYTVPLVRLPPLIGDKAVHRLRFILRAGDPILDNGGAMLVADYSVKTGYHRAQALRIAFKYDYVNDASIDLDIAAPGTFAFKVESRLPAEKHATTIPLDPQTTHVLVEPTLTVLGVPLPTLDAIVLQSVVPKWLGPLSTWSAQFKTLGKLNFNLVHFVPMQPRGISNSPYSLLDQLDVSPDLFEQGKLPPTVDARWAAVSHVLGEIEAAGLLAMTDVVWNHTACNSPWLRAHPESGYNLVNSPHLYPAYLLDDALQNYSYRVATGQVAGVNPLLTSADDVAKLLRHFHAFRIDNCHSTPRHLAAYLLDEARAVRPHLYVVAELFTGDAAVDRLYAAELGIHSLIREAMQAWDAKELSRLVHRYSGDPVGSFHAAGAGPAVCMATPHHAVDVRAAEPHALFMDCTHDNEPPAQRRSVLDSVANAAVTAMASCAVGSTLGYDWCIPKHLNVVHEARTYPQLDRVQGMQPLRAALGELHRRMALENMSEVYVHHEEPYIIVYRQDPILHRGVILIARSAFTRPAAGVSTRAPLSPLVLKRTQAKLILAQALEIVGADGPKDPSVIDGVPVRLADQAHRVTVSVDAQQNTVVALDPATPPGTAVLLETWLTNNDQLAKLHDLESLEGTKKSGIADLCAKLSFNELNQLLYRTDSEEREVGGGVYDVPGYGPFAYCGISGMAAVLRPIMRANDLGHPMCDNLRQGPWMLDYTVDRLKRYISDNKAPLAQVRDWLHERMQLVKTVPNYLVPKYFALVVVSAEGAARRAAADMMGRFVAKSGSFVRNLAMTAVQMLAFVPSASLHPTESKAALAAGLPHFATAHMRCWGRDILIALRGLLLRTGQTQAAKDHIIALGSTIKHGLIPNLLDSGRYPRYNARDAAWWWVQAVQDYVRLVPNGAELLTTVVARRFPSNDQWVHWTDKRAYAEKATVLELVVEVLARHAKGIHFREHNAGPQLDHAMTHDGFQVDAFIDWNRGGFVFGGNAMNCGSWMDKMGDSHKAGNYGIPATPRDGADVDLQALLYNCVSWLDDLHAAGTLAADGVTKPSGEKVSWAAWRAMLEASFEPMFYVPPADDVEAMQKGAAYLDSQVLSTPHVRRGIYKDTLGGSNKWADYQFRPNQFVAMAMAPSLFNPAHARTALDLGLTVLAGPLGMRTLDPADPNYRGHYHNNDDGYDRTTAHGWNYHQGPEWVWQAGYFYQAYLAVHLAAAKSPDEVNAVLHTVHARTAPARVHLARAPYAGLPELTNKDGEECPGSCMTQAWSSASFLELAWMIVQARATRLNRSLTMDAHARRHRRTRAATPEEAMAGVAEVEVETEEDEEDDA